MGQIFGIGGIHDAGDLRQTLTRMGNAMRRTHQPDLALWVDPAAGVGLGCLPDQPATAACPPVVLDGVFYRGELADSPSSETDLLARASADESGFLRGLDGSFTFALYLANPGRLIVANDRFSSRTMYWTESAGRFLFSSELKGLLAVPGVTPDLDRAVLAQCAAFNRVLGQRTLVRNVTRLAAATIVQWDARSGTRLTKH